MTNTNTAALPTKIVIIAYDLKGTYVGEWDTIGQAVKSLNLKGNWHIREAIRDSSRSALFWR